MTPEEETAATATRNETVASAEADETAATTAPDEAAASAKADETAAKTTPDEKDAAAPAPPKRGLRGLLARIPIPHPKTRGGVLLMSGVLLVIGVGVALGGTQAVHYSESTAFCTMCHTMVPQQKSNADSAHASVDCAACHVTPTLAGFVSAKLAGTKELYALVTDTYPRPIPPIHLDQLPTAQDTCLTCHQMAQITKGNGPSDLILRSTFASDEANTRKNLAVLLRAANSGTPQVLGVHWHVEDSISFTSSDEHLQTIDSVEYTDPETGQLRQYIAVSKVREAGSAGADIARLKATEQTRMMDCRDCHNRVGHDVPTANDEIDAAMAVGKIDPTLPYVKKTAMSLITASYKTSADGLAAVAGLSRYYQTQYPDIAAQRTNQIAASTTELQRIYSLVNTPEMGVGNMTYPSNLGHQHGPGCYRCHDGAHYLVAKDGTVTKTAIRSTCDTCHTFPQFTSASGAAVPPPAELLSAVPMGVRPEDHLNPLWVFDHKTVATSALPSGTACGVCHQPAYCVNCHASGAISVDHTTMLYQHSVSIRDAGGTTACAVCHQPSYCDQCHKGTTSILGPSNSRLDTSQVTAPK